MRPGGMPAESFAAEDDTGGTPKRRVPRCRRTALKDGAEHPRAGPHGRWALAANGVSQWDRARVIVAARATNDASMDDAARRRVWEAGGLRPSLLPSSWDIFLLPAGRVGTFNVELSTKSRRSLVVAPRRRPTCSRQHPSSYRAMPTRPRTTPTAIRSSIPRTTATRRLFYKVSSFLRGERFSPKSCRSSTSSTLSASPCSREAAARASRPLITINAVSASGRQVQDYRLPRLC